MPVKLLHEREEFPDLLRILERDTGILAGLIEKDYWIMHVLYGLSRQGFSFEMKGGTSLSKGYGIISRFSEDIDVQINPPQEMGVKANPKNTKDHAVASRKGFYDWLADNIKIEGIVSVERDTAFDNTNTYTSGGIRLHYKSYTENVPGLKEGILLEAGFDTVTPNNKLTISSWGYDKAAATAGFEIVDNRATDIACYHPGYTFVEKLQTIATKFRQERESGKTYPNLMRQYYDISCLLDHEAVQAFIGTNAYHAHKEARFKGQEKGIVIRHAEAFLLSDPNLRTQFKERYAATASLYYKGQPPFDDILAKIHGQIERL
jgi:hypothetical protein